MKRPRDQTPYRQDPRSVPIGPTISDGLYVYVQDESGEIWVLIDEGHAHPRVLGGGRPAMYAGDLTVRAGIITDVTNLSGTFRFTSRKGLRSVAAKLREQGLRVSGGAVRFFPRGGRRPAPGDPGMRRSMRNSEPQQICILEDNHDRRNAMREFLAERFYQFKAIFFDDAQQMIRHLKTNLPATILIGLDHDLELTTNGQGKTMDPGTGRDVVDWLATRSPVCPVVIHSTNTTAVQGMQLRLEEHGWRTYRVEPWGDLAWIDKAWKPAVRKAILQTAQPAGKPKRTRTAG